MKIVSVAAALLTFQLLFPAGGFAQSEFHIVFRGRAYETNASGQIEPRRITEHTLLKDAAESLGVTDLKSVALVYHVNGSSFGDTIDVVNASNGVALTTLFGFFFGDDTSLNRVALTNNVGNIVRRIDYVYTHQNSHSMGAAFTTKRYVNGGAGNNFPVIDAKMHWVVAPEGKSGTEVCIASFTTTRPFKPRP